MNRNFHIYKQGKYKIKIFNQLNNENNFANIFIHKSFLQSYKKSYRVKIGDLITITIPKKNCWQTKNSNYWLCSIGVERNYWVRDNLKIIKEKVKGWILLLRYKFLEDFSFEQSLNCSIEKERLENQEFLKKSYAERLAIIQNKKQEAATKKRNFFARKQELENCFSNEDSFTYPPDLPVEDQQLYYQWVTSLSRPDNTSFEEYKRSLEPIPKEISEKLLQEIIDM